MPSFLSPDRLARTATRHPWIVVGAWVALFFAAIASASTIGGVLTTEASTYRQSDSSRADDLLVSRLYGVEPDRETVVIHSETATVDDPAFASAARSIVDDIRALPGVEVISYFDSQAPSLVSETRHSLIIPVTVVSGVAEDQAQEIIDILAGFNGKNGLTAVVGGEGSTSIAFNETSESDLQTAEIIGLPIALIILVVVFGALVAAGVPLLLGVLSIIVAVGLTAIIGRAFELSVFVVNIITTMGLAVGIDYSLLVIQRFREERAHGLSRDAAIEKAGGTASRAVLFSGTTVVVALAGLIIVPQSIFRSMGIGAIVVVVAAVAAALTLLPAVLRLLGDRVNAVSIRIPWRRNSAPRPSFWDRSTKVVMAHPWISVIASTAILLAATLPYITVELGWAGVSTLPKDSSARQAFELLNTEFSAGVLAPAQIVVDSDNVDSPAVQSGIDRLVAELGSDPVFGDATIVTNDDHDLAVIETAIVGDPQGDAAQAAVHRLRDDLVPTAFASSGAKVYVTGATAAGIDDTNLISDYTIPVMAFVLGLSFVILLVVFRSIVVPLKAMVMNLLSVGAAYGLMVLVFQHGVGASLFGFQTVERIEAWVPLFMFAILFGLSMDYHVFLLTRIKERFDNTRNNAESVAYGVRSTAGMITGAALIMVAVFSGFAAGEMVMFQQFGFGLAVAIFLDATIVRTVLVPASMELLGDRNWYLPSWLGWLPSVDIEGKVHDHEARPALGLASEA
ncbi:MAG: MMPL family transporter [Dehalococcoidia bacterium]